MCTNGPGCIIDSESNASFIEINSIKYYSDRFYLNEPCQISEKRLENPLANNTKPWSTFDRNKLIESLDLSCAIIATYCINWNWIEKEIPSLFGDDAKIPVLLLHHDRKSNLRHGETIKLKQGAPEEEGWDDKNSKTAKSRTNVSVVKVKSFNKENSYAHIGVHHPKYMLLFEKSGSVVVVISTCNLTKPSSFEGFWMQRFGKSNRRLMKYREGMNDFGWVLANFLKVQTDFAATVQDDILPFSFLERYLGISSTSELACAFQFDKANVFLVASVPGNHVGLQSSKKYYSHNSSDIPPMHYGPQRISYIMQNFLLPSSCSAPTQTLKFKQKLLSRQTKKLKIKHRKSYLPLSLLSPRDKIVIQGTTYGHSWNQANMLPVLQSYLANNDDPNIPRSLKNLSIIWPSMSYMQSCTKVLGHDSKIAFLTSQNFNTIDLAILSRMVLYRPLPLFPWQMEKSQDIPISPHIKSVSRIIKKDIIVPINSNNKTGTTYLSYFMLTSSNFSQGAQGKHVPSEYDTMGYANFELGVLFSSRVQGNPFQDRIYASTSIHNLQNTNKCLHCHSYCKILPLNKKVKVIYLPIPFQLENCSSINNYMKEEDDTDMMYTPYLSEIQEGTEGIGNMRLTPFGKEWIRRHHRSMDNTKDLSLVS